MRLVSKIILILLLPTLCWGSFSESHFVAVADTIGGAGEEWNNWDSVFADDAQYADAAGKIKNGGHMEIIDFKMGSQHFTIPAGSTYDSMKVEIEAVDVQNGPAGDSLVKALIDGSPSGDDQKVETDDWPTSLAIKSWQGTFGITPTIAQLNDTAFGVRVQIVEVDGSFSDLELDYCKITVWYTPPTATAVEVIEPEAIGAQDNWDSSGTGNKVQMITDATDANYIYSINSVLDEYTLTNLSADTSDFTPDSLVVVLRAQDNNTGNDSVAVQIKIGSDVTTSIAYATTQSWAEYKFSVTSLPGGRSMSIAAIDSAIVRIREANTVGEQVQVTACSVLVYGTLVAPEETYFFTATDTNCAAGDNFGHLMSFRLEHPLDTIEVLVPGGTTENDMFTSESGSPNDASWPTGGVIVRLNIIKQVNPGSLQVRIQRLNSSCTVQESTPFYPATGALIAIDSTGEYTIDVPSHDWSDGATGDRLRVNLRWTNALFESQDTVWIEVGVWQSSLETSIIDLANPDKSASGCATVETLDPDQVWSAGLNEWAAVGGSKVEVVTDAVDANYIEDPTGTKFQGFTLGATGIGGGTIDSVFVVSIAQTIDGKKIQFRVYKDSSSTDYCQGGQQNAPDTWDTTTVWKVPGFPNGANQCTASWSTARLDSLMIIAVSDRKGGTQVTKFWLEVCYTAAGGGAAGQIIRVTIGKTEEEKTGNDKFAEVLGYRRGTVIGFKPQKWLWGG